MKKKLGYLLRMVLMLTVSYGVAEGSCNDRVTCYRVALVSAGTAVITSAVGVGMITMHAMDNPKSHHDAWDKYTIREIAGIVENAKGEARKEALEKARMYLITAPGTLADVCYSAGTVLWTDDVCRYSLLERVKGIQGNMEQVLGCWDSDIVKKDQELLDALEKKVPSLIPHDQMTGYDDQYVGLLNGIRLDWGVWKDRASAEDMIRSLAGTVHGTIGFSLLLDISKSRLWSLPVVQEIVKGLIPESVMDVEDLSTILAFYILDSGIWKDEQMRHLAIKHLLTVNPKHMSLLGLLFMKRNFEELPEKSYDWGPEIDKLAMEWLKASKVKAAYGLQYFWRSALAYNEEMKEMYLSKHIPELEYMYALTMFYKYYKDFWNDDFAHPLLVEQVNNQGTVMTSCAPGQNYWADEDVKEKTTAYIKAHARDFIDLKHNTICPEAYAKTLEIAKEL